MSMNLESRVHRMSRLIQELDGPMESLTGAVCPQCTEPCCLHRHMRPDAIDILYLDALGLGTVDYLVPLSADNRDAPCPFLQVTGCRLPRHHRPYRCTWYFCDSLLQEMESRPGRAMRELSDQLRQLAEYRLTLTELVRSDNTPDCP